MSPERVEIFMNALAIAVTDIVVSMARLPAFVEFGVLDVNSAREVELK
jgi:hypothetical protein